MFLIGKRAEQHPEERHGMRRRTIWDLRMNMYIYIYMVILYNEDEHDDDEEDYYYDDEDIEEMIQCHVEACLKTGEIPSARLA